VDRRSPISGKLEQDAGRDIEWRAWRKKHCDDIERDLSVIGEIAKVGADRCVEIGRSELADQRGERTQFTGCHQLRFLLLKCPKEFALRSLAAARAKADYERFVRSFNPLSNALGLAHKFTRMNCFNDLSALSRNFFRSLARPETSL
jgi:hypothetical protein